MEIVFDNCPTSKYAFSDSESEEEEEIIADPIPEEKEVIVDPPKNPLHKPIALPDHLAKFNNKVNTADLADMFLMESFLNQEQIEHIYKCVNNSQNYKQDVKQYSFRYGPVTSLYIYNPFYGTSRQTMRFSKKLYTVTDITYLEIVAQSINNPLELFLSKSFLDPVSRQQIINCDDNDINFIILLKMRKFYESVFNAIKLSLEFEGQSKQYSYKLESPKWFLDDHKFSKLYNQKEMINVWKHRSNFMILHCFE